MKLVLISLIFLLRISPALAEIDLADCQRETGLSLPEIEAILSKIREGDPYLTCRVHQANISRAPLCPENSTVLTDDYPVMAVTISDQLGGLDFLKEFVKKSFAAQKEMPPLFFVNASPGVFRSLAEYISELPGSEAEKKLRSRSLRRVPAEFEFNWQQDFYQAFFDPKTGLPTTRYVSGYEEWYSTNEPVKDLFQAVQSGLTECGIQERPSLDARSTKFGGKLPGGTSGGNIEAIPPGICIIGDDNFIGEENWENYAQQACGKNNPVIKAPTHWLGVGHADEIIHAVPSPNKKAPCNFSVVFPSPAKAFDILKNSPQSLAFRKAEKAEDFFPSAARKSRRENFPTHLEKFCEQNGFGLDRCQALTNKELLQAFKQQHYEFNQLAQREIDQLKAEVRKQLKKMLPQCEPDLIDLPNLYIGKTYRKREPNSWQETPVMRPQSGNDLLPNPVNGLALGKSFLVPDPHNESFRTYIKDEFNKRGVKTDFVDTFDSYRKNGNLHCATQAIRYCRPRSP